MRPDGVYLHLPFEDYLDDDPDRLGGTDKARLWLRGPGWWWASRHNPFRPARKRSPELLFGEAAHAALLEGLHQYESRYIVEPSRADHPDALTTIPQMKAAMRDAGVYPARSSDWKLEDWCEAMETYLPEVEVWPNILAEFDRRTRTHNGGRRRTAIDAEADFAIRAMRELAVDAAHSSEEMREIFSVGSKFPVLAEVSVFWTDAQGIRHRARFDKFLPVLTADMKTVGDWRGKPLADSLDDHIKRMGYDVQMADYHLARQAAIRMVLEDEANLHGGAEEERNHFIATCRWNDIRNAEGRPVNQWDWMFLFYQKPSAAGAAPILFPLRQRWGSTYHLAGFRKRHVALETYRDYLGKFGLERPWGKVETIHWTHPDDAPKGASAITSSPYGWGPDSEVPGEREHMESL